jgi:hypothetical protein
MDHTAFLSLAAGILLLTPGLVSQNPKELGKVSWLRDHDEALAQSKKTRKPVFLLFQEVPG